MAGFEYYSGRRSESTFFTERIGERVFKTVEDDDARRHPFLYAVKGADKIVVIDTGVGGGDYHAHLRGIPQLASLPIVVINTSARSSGVRLHSVASAACTSWSPAPPAPRQPC